MNRLKDPWTKRPQNWYLRGWEYRDVPGPDGRPRRRLVYTGEYYSVRLDHPARRRRKLGAVIVYLALCAVYLGFELTQTVGGFVWYAGAPCLLAMIPIFYLGLGVFNFAAAEEYFTFRRMRAAWFRMRVGGLAAALLLGAGTAGQLAFILIYGRLLDLGPELFMLFGALFCCACAAALTALQKKTRPEVVSPREYAGPEEKR